MIIERVEFLLFYLERFISAKLLYLSQLGGVGRWLVGWLVGECFKSWLVGGLVGGLVVPELAEGWVGRLVGGLVLIR